VIFSQFPRVVVKLGDERYVYDRKTFTFLDAQRVEEATGMAYPDWEWALFRSSVTAVAALLHVLRLRDGVPSDFKSLAFTMSDLDYVPLHDDDSEYTAEEVTEEVTRRIAEAQPDAGPTPAAAAPEAPSGEDRSAPPRPTSPSSPAATESGRGSGTGSRTRTGSSSRPTRKPT
jgi:hypothetical protein